MARKKQSPEELLREIQVPGFDRQPPTDRNPTETLTGMALRLPIGEVDSYTDNPRRTKNPLYNEIMESIRAVGQRQPVLVSRNPQTDRYTLIAGGNTRLQILTELYDETGDDRFSTIYTIYQPWGDDDEEHLLAHLVENELRGAMTFVDAGAARLKLQARWEEGSDSHLTDREVADRLRTHGISANPTHISLMRYAVESLLPQMPLALSAGMGRPTVARIRKIERAARSTLARNDIDHEPWVKNRCWEILLAEIDVAGLHADAVRNALEDRLIQYVESMVDDPNIGYGWVMSDFLAYLEGEEDTLPPPSWRTPPPREPETEPEPDHGAANRKAVSGDDGDDDGEEPSLFGFRDQGTADQHTGEPVGDSDLPKPANIEPDISSTPLSSSPDPVASTSDRDALRAEIRQLAESLAMMRGSAWRDVGDQLSDPELDSDSAHTINQLFVAFQSYQTGVSQ